MQSKLIRVKQNNNKNMCTLSVDFALYTYICTIQSMYYTDAMLGV